MKHWLAFSLGQFLQMLLLLLLVSMVAFALVTVSPVDPLQANVGQAALGALSPQQLERLEAHWGADTPPVQRYLGWLADFIRGDMGTSLLYRRSVASVVAEKVGASLLLLVSAWMLSGLLGLFLGIIAGAWHASPADKLIKNGALLLSSLPTFWVGLLLLMVFSVWLGLLPIGFSAPIDVSAASVTVLDRVRHALLPVVTLGVTGCSGLILHVREKMLELMQSDYILFAKARGDTTLQIILRHGLRGVLPPALTLQFASVGELIGGSVLVEQVFSYPGMGQAAVSAGIGGDVPLLLGITVITAAIVFAGNMTANLLHSAIDPRLGQTGQEVVPR